MIELADMNGCPVCKHLSKAAFEFLIGWFGILKKSGKTNPSGHSIHGICSFHLWQIVRLFSPAGLDEALAPILLITAERLEDAVASLHDHTEKLRQLFPAADGCDACAYLKKEEQQAIEGVARTLGTINGRSEYEKAGGVCHQHLSLLAIVLEDDTLIHFVTSVTASRLRAIARDMQEFARKHHALKRDLITETERVAHQRGAMQLAGADTILNSRVILIQPDP